jgi:hypothetical protein
MGLVYLVVDGHPMHRSKLVKQFVASTDGALKLFVLPAYSPQVKHDEWVWKNAGVRSVFASPSSSPGWEIARNSPPKRSRVGPT